MRALAPGAVLVALLLLRPLGAQEATEVGQATPRDTTSSVTKAAYPVDPEAARTPFGPGEKLEYKVKLGIFAVGSAHMEVEGVDTVAGRRAYVAHLDIKGGIAFARVDDDLRSWFDVGTLASRRFVQDIHEVKYKSHRFYEMLPDEQRWWRKDNDETGPMLTSLPLDDIAFIYYIRTLDLEVGKTYTLNRYFKESGNPVIIQVLRKDERKVPAGTFRTIVVKPIIRTKGLFSEGGNAEIHFSDDERRLVVYLRSEIPVVGSVTLHLRKIEEGLPLNPDSRKAAEARGVAGDPAVAAEGIGIPPGR